MFIFIGNTTNLIRVILVDDEIDNLKMLQSLLDTYCPQVRVLGTAEGVESATALIRAKQPDLVFLDIEMVQGNAFDLLNRLQPIDFHVIFVTAFDNYAIRAFKYNAIDYLLKPVNIRELCAAVERVSARTVESNVLDRLRMVLTDFSSGADPAEKKIAIPTVTGLSFVSLRDISWLEAKGSYTELHLQNGTKMTSSGTIKDYEDMLPDSIFYRVHHSFIINLNKVKVYQKGRGGMVTMEDGQSIEVSARRRDGFMQRVLK